MVIWEQQAVDDLAELVGRDRRRAKALYETVQHMGKLGWAYMGRRTTGGLMYFPVAPFGVFYRLTPGELRVVQVVDARRLRKTP